MADKAAGDGQVPPDTGAAAAAAGTKDGKDGAAAAAAAGGKGEENAGGDGKGKEGTTDDGKGKQGDKGGKDGAGTPQPKTADKFDLKIPDGAEDLIGDTDLKLIRQIAASEKWTEEETQQRLEQHADHIAATSAAFRTETEADPDYGGDKLEETQQLAKRALEKVRPAGHKRHDSFNAMLKRSGYGNNIEVISLLADFGRMMREDTPATGGGSGGGGNKKSAEQVLYGGTTSKE